MGEIAETRKGGSPESVVRHSSVILAFCSSGIPPLRVSAILSGISAHLCNQWLKMHFP
jgi:hypothetical protein